MRLASLTASAPDRVATIPTNPTPGQKADQPSFIDDGTTSNVSYPRPIRVHFLLRRSTLDAVYQR